MASIDRMCEGESLREARKEEGKGGRRRNGARDWREIRKCNRKRRV